MSESASGYDSPVRGKPKGLYEARMGLKGKKNMLDFMKAKLAKTKQSSNQVSNTQGGFVMIGSSTCGPSKKNFKKKPKIVEEETPKQVKRPPLGNSNIRNNAKNNEKAKPQVTQHRPSFQKSISKVTSKAETR
jgi:hypothetical protein